MPTGKFAPCPFSGFNTIHVRPVAAAIRRARNGSLYFVCACGSRTFAGPLFRETEGYTYEECIQMGLEPLSRPVADDYDEEDKKK